MKKNFNQKLQLNMDQIEVLSKETAKLVVGGNDGGTTFKDTKLTSAQDNTRTTIRTIPFK